MSPPIVLACDAAYAMPLATTLRSIVEANLRYWPINLHLVTNGFTAESKAKVVNSLPHGSTSIRWVDLDLTPFKAFSTAPHVSKSTYARLSIPQIFPESVPKVLYLDTDTLVLGDLRPLLEADLEGAVVGAVLDGLDLKLKANQAGLAEVPRVGSYFNAGVLLIDMEQWRRERISERSLEYLSQHPRSPFSDQDALNVACDRRWKRLDPRWNFQGHIGNRISDMDPAQRPWIVHFVTDLKPWRADSHSVNASLYDEFRRRTCFARTYRQQAWDVVEGVFSRLRSLSRRCALLRAIWSEIKRERSPAATSK